MTKHIFVLALILGLSACGHRDSDKANVGLGWKPQDVRITCPSGDCPDVTGVLIFGRRTPSGYSLSRCTATQTAPDQILTNAHCDNPIPELTYAWFIKPDGQIAAVTQKIFEAAGKVSGLDRDLAIFKLDHALSGVPKTISRQIPNSMDRLIGYVIDQTYWDRDFTSLSLNKRECRVDKHMPLMGGGSDDKTLGVAVFDCEVRHGNSGSALYSPGDTQNIQALLNTLWHWSEATSKSDVRLKSLFLEEPDFMKRDYGMAERLHCADVPGQTPPVEYCHKVDFDQTVGQKYRESLVARVDEWFAANPTNSGGVEWTLKFFPGVLSRRESDQRSAAAMIPSPYCVYGSLGPARLPAVIYHLGLLPKDGAESRVESETPISFDLRDGIADHTSIHSAWPAKFLLTPFTPSPQAAGGYREISSNLRSQALPACSASARTEARDRALENLNSAIRISIDYL